MVRQFAYDGVCFCLTQTLPVFLKDWQPVVTFCDKHIKLTLILRSCSSLKKITGDNNDFSKTRLGQGIYEIIRNLDTFWIVNIVNFKYFKRYIIC